MGQLRSDDFNSPVTGIALSGDANCVAASLLNGKIGLVERATGEVLSEYSGHKAGNYSLGVSLLSDSTTLASCSEDGYTYLYDLVKRTVISKLDEESSSNTSSSGGFVRSGAVISVSAHPDKNILLAANSKDKYALCYR